MLALGEVIARYYRHPSQVDRAVRAGASWEQIAAATDTTEEAARATYREWAEGQHEYAGMSEADYAEAITGGGLIMPEVTRVPGQVRGQDIEDQADELADAAARLAELLTAFTQEPRRSMDVIAVFRLAERDRGINGVRGRRAPPPGMVRPERR